MSLPDIPACATLAPEPPMNPHEYLRAHLAENLDVHGDIAPPWEKFPAYERMTIGWRMGDGGVR